MQVICLEDAALHALIEEVVKRLTEKQKDADDKWINDEQAMALLNVKSKSTMQKLRDEGKIRFSQRQKKNILYDRHSILAFIENNAKDTF